MGFLIPLCIPLLLLISGGVNIGQSEATSNTLSFDPCKTYTALDQPWRANNETGLDICDSNFYFHGWYRLFYYGMNIRMSESCVPTSRCGSYFTLWLNGPHPQIEDGVVRRQVCANAGYDCCLFSSTSIQVKACPGNYYVYKIVRPHYCNMAYCTDVNTIAPNPAPTSPATNLNINMSSSPTNQSFDPCNTYSIVDDYWRNARINYYGGHDDTVAEWKGWYRLYIEGKSAQIADTNWCERYYRRCGGYTPLWLSGSHPRLEDGIVTREIYRPYNNWNYGFGCTFSRSHSVQVKGCPGGYYVYKLTKPDVSLPMPTYCAVAFNSLTYDPCHNYTSLDQPWRANNETGLNICDRNFNWNGWYRLFYYGMNIRMPESCVDVNRCGSYYTLWLNGSHPQIEDGVVTRQVCGNAGYDCCYFRSTPIRVKACSGNYYVYELVSTEYCNMAYCTDVDSITQTSGSEFILTPTSNYNTDPCYDYHVLDDDWRNTHTYFTSDSRGHDDTLVDWNGWYRLYLHGKSAQISEWCVSFSFCGGYIPLWLNGTHPQLGDGIVTREIYGTNHLYDYNNYYYYYYYYYYYNNNQCSYSYRSNPVQVKACPGNYYVYKLVKPELSIPMPSYCAVAFDNVTDPCYNYVSLDQPWRANNESGTWSLSDGNFYWNGWYRLFYYGMNIRMSESSVPIFHCGSYYTLWLDGSHPQIEDGVVTLQVCGNIGYDWCSFRSNPIRVKACPGNYYVYEFISSFINSVYCTDVSTITPIASPTAPTGSELDTMTTTPTDYSFDPCNTYTALDDDWRNVTSWYYWYWNFYLNKGYDDTLVEWNGWYRLFFHGENAQILEGCVSYTACGGYTALWLEGSHPRPEDGIVTRGIYGSIIDGNIPCNKYRSSHPIQVKACPGDYYVYKLVKPDVSLPRPTYCTVVFTKPTDDPCYNYNELDDLWRATNQTNNGWWWCDSSFTWNGWYRLLYDGNNVQMPESCVNQGMCGTDIPLWLNGSHPRLEDGVVSRQVCGSWSGDCCYFKSFPIQVKACPGDYYVYELVSPPICASAYCTEVDGFSLATAPEFTTVATTTTTTDVGSDTFTEIPQTTTTEPPTTTSDVGSDTFTEIPQTTTTEQPTTTSVVVSNPSTDPCYNYSILDEPWRATDSSYNWWGLHCDRDISWNGWYRLLYHGNNIRMPESCVNLGMCGTHASLWLNGSHPRLEDGVVSRQVCGSWYAGCCAFNSFPIQVKACPGNYYVYEFVRPVTCYLAYCADVGTTTPSEITTTPEPTTTTTTTEITTTTAPLNNHTGPFYPFGLGDTENGRSDDGGSPAISLLQPFKFFGITYAQVYVNNNGDLTFDQAWYSFSPYQFPANGGRDIIAPFWTDIDNRGNGVISYQQYTSGSVLTQATQDINQYFPQLHFSATWVFVATWDRVAYFYMSGTETSFQVVLISDGQLSFVLMNYGQIAPTGRGVQAGYDTRDSSYYFSIPGSFQYNYNNDFTYRSNVNVTGRWAFRVDQGSQSCQFNGDSVPQGTSFWTDSSCWERCTCTRNGLQCSSQPCTFSQACRPAALQYSCQNVQRQTCTISGDPHFYTFDNQIFHFQGTCTYVLSEACGDGLPYYRIEGKNEHRGSTRVSWTRLVKVFVYDEELELVKDHRYEAKVNGSFASTPFSLRNGSIQVYQSGFSVAISTDFGLVVTYDAYSYVTISVPFDYQNATCGLCGNFNHRPDDDFRTPSGEVLSSDTDFANSWTATGDTDAGCQNTCSGLTCAACTEAQRNLYNNPDFCGILSDSAGPFSSCQPILSPQTFIENCVYDLCVGGGYQPILCQALNVYAAQCQQQGVQLVHWRRQGFCEISCPGHSHFESSGTSCPATCSNPTAPVNCPLPNQESCICDAGYVLSAGECVSQANCGCTFEGLYYASGQSVILDEDCGRQCSCNSGVMSCQYYQCGPQEMCAIHNGVRGCRPIGYSTCWVEGPGFYHTYDGLMFSYPGACGLTLTRVMGLSPLPNFAVTVQKQPYGPQGFSRVLTFEAEGTQVSIKMEEGGSATVDGQEVALPFSVGSGRIHIYHSSVKGIIMETTFGVTVRADWPHLIRITAPSTYNGTLGGLCGNLNGHQEDEFFSPNGVLLNDSRTFGDSWRDGSLSAYCEESTDIWQKWYYQDSSQFRLHCSILSSPTGPFAQCHSSLDPLVRVEDCIRSLQQAEGAKEALCEALRGYAVLCQQNGVVLQEWRNITDCEFPCPTNSHYELCGTSCPAACPSLSFPYLCTQYCQEGCQCDDGLLLSGDHCVPPIGCGCLHEGRYRQGGERFWYGEQCQSLCTCDGTTGFVRCNPSSCSEQETCRIVGGEYGCHPQPRATCSASGDPHYTSFDGHKFDFQGTCRYILSTVCSDNQGLPFFQVVARNEPWNGLRVSITVEVSVNVSGHLVHVSRNMRGTAEIDSETKNLPVLLDSGSVSVYSSGQSTFITTDFGLSVSYDGSWVVRITVPANYSGATCGLCGNFNGQTNDDFQTRSGELAPSASQFGADWKVWNDTSCDDGCGDSCARCQNPVSAMSQCEILRDRQGPVSFCHSFMDPEAYFNDCAFDLCLSEYQHDVLCRSIQTYVSACQSANAPVLPWRQNTTCRMDCPMNSHYELCGTDCEHTCASSIDAVCEHACSEGCFCNEGFVRSGGLCVPVEQCGCLYNGFYFNIGEKFWTQDCSQRCDCFAPNDLRCSAASCAPTQECMVKNGQRGCYSTMSSCMVWGDPHYLTFDGAVTTFQGTCSYEISKTCVNVLDNGLEFLVVATNMHRENKIVSFASVVDIWLTKWGQRSHITIGQNKRVKIDGTDMDSSAFQIGQLAEVHQEHDFVVVNASSELMVYFDGRFTLLVKLDQSFHGSVCGMCGNNNGDAADDKAMPSGALAPSDDVFGNSWRSDISPQGCGAIDQRYEVNDCPFKQEYSEVCSIITNTSGPFQHCHFFVNPIVYFTSCVYDLCVYSSDNGMLCSALEAYEVACTSMGLEVSEWRSDLGCSHTDPCAELECTADEWCGEKDNIYGCFCNENHPRPRKESYDSTEECESSSGTMSLSRCQLFEAGFSANVLHLSDPNCTGTLQNGRLVFYFDNDAHNCGTNLVANGTHFIYENTIQGGADSAGGPIHRKKYLELRFSCIYQISQTLSMDTELNPLESIVHKNLPDGQGMYQVRIIPYQDAGLSQPYNGSVKIVVDERIYVGVFVQGVDSRQIATVIDSCWATPENDQHHAVRWDLITNRCPNPADMTVEVLQNGVSTTGLFSFRMFSFNGNYHKVFLHCSIHLCLLPSNNCAEHCFPGFHHRAGRSVDIHDTASISVGPFIWTV